jgi:hypothetical protein
MNPVLQHCFLQGKLFYADWKAIPIFVQYQIAQITQIIKTGISRVASTVSRLVMPKITIYCVRWAK